MMFTRYIIGIVIFFFVVTLSLYFQLPNTNVNETFLQKRMKINNNSTQWKNSGSIWFENISETSIYDDSVQITRITSSSNKSNLIQRQKFTVLTGTIIDGGGRFIPFIYQFQCCAEIIDEIHINWKDLDAESFAEFKTFFEKNDFDIDIVVYTAKNMRISHRFASIPDVRTDFVYIIDDDVLIKPDGIEPTFQRCVETKYHMCGYGIPFSTKKQAYDPKFPMPYEFNPQGLTTGGGVFIHADYIKVYFTMEKIREHVDRQSNCEDIALNFLVALNIKHKNDATILNTTNLYSYPKNQDIYKSWNPKIKKKYNLSEKSNHGKDRDECVRMFGAILGVKLFEGKTKSFGWNKEMCTWEIGGSCEEVGAQKILNWIGKDYKEFKKKLFK